MKTKPKHNVDWRSIILLVFIAGGLAALFSIPTLFRPDETDQETYAANRERIEQMTETERERVKHRAERYFSKSEAERERIRKLHHDLQHDKDAAELKKVLARYNDWLTSLSPYEREEIREKLRQAKSLEEKLVVIEDQRNLQFVRTLEGPDREFFDDVKTAEDRRKRIAQFREYRETYRPGMRSSRSPFPTVDLEDLDPLFRAMEAKLDLSVGYKKEMDALSPTQRIYRIATLALRKKNSPENARFSSGPFSDSNMRKMVEEVVDDPELKEKLIGSRNRRAWFSISQSLFRERGKTAGKPTDQQLSDFFTSLSAEKQDELMQTSGSDRIKKLRQWYFRSGGKDGKEFQDFMSEWFKTWRPWGGKFRSPRSGSRGPRNGRTEQRRPDNKRPETPPNGKRP